MRQLYGITAKTMYHKIRFEIYLLTTPLIDEEAGEISSRRILQEFVIDSDQKSIHVDGPAGKLNWSARSHRKYEDFCLMVLALIPNWVE
jgi:hypothetical protein